MTFTDQIGHQIQLNTTPKRIISVVPSQTELLFDLGLEDEVVGITKFCIHPKKWFDNKQRVGGTKTLDIKKIKALKPDLIIANKEENTKEQIFELQKLFPVWTSNISTLDESLEMITQIGIMTSTSTLALEICKKIEHDFERLANLHFKAKSTLYFIWKRPYMTVGKNTFIHCMMQQVGFNNVVDSDKNYPELSNKQIMSYNPQLILLSSEPYPFKEKDMLEFKNLCPNAQIVLVDGEMFSWYGSRLTKTVDYLIDLYSKIN
ncbi:MAG: ABC transporter substrate-binding protein [Flavobacteriales bacterium]|nr:ABC transporter substrate-binding protein [Flavobacteriales bacterium]